MPAESRPSPNRLLLPLIAACAVCVAEAIVIAFLLGRGTPPAKVTAAGQVDHGSPPAAPPASGPTPASESGRPAPPSGPQLSPAGAGPAVVRGKVHQRVEAGGLALTVVDVTNKPRFEALAPRADEKFVDCDVLLENGGASAVRYYGAEFKIQDDQARVFNGNSIGVGSPQLGFGAIVPGSKVRGHVAFDLPHDAKGLALTYPVDSGPHARAIHIDLGQ